MAGENKREATLKWESGFLSRLFVRENFQLLVNKRPGGLQYIEYVRSMCLYNSVEENTR